MVTAKRIYHSKTSESLAVHLVAWSVALAMAESGIVQFQNGYVVADQESLNRVIIIDMSGETLCEVWIASDCTVRMLKEEIERKIHVPSVEQHLTCAESTLVDESATMRHFAIDGAPIVVSLFVQQSEARELKLIFSLMFKQLAVMFQHRMRQEPFDN